MQLRFYGVMEHAVNVARFQLRIIRKNKSIPETEEIVSQLIGASICVGAFLCSCVDRKLSFDDTQLNKIAQVSAGFRGVVYEGLLADFIERLLQSENCK